MKMWHLPNGEEQQKRDQHWATMGSIKKPDGYVWDGTPVDDPPKGYTDRTVPAYFRGHKVVEFTNRKLNEMGI